MSEFLLDAARFAENAWLVTQREPEYHATSPAEVAQRAFRLADACVVSLKKDGVCPMGAFLAMNDAGLADRCELILTATEGFRTYGGLAGHELDRLAQGAAGGAGARLSAVPGGGRGVPGPAGQRRRRRHCRAAGHPRDLPQRRTAATAHPPARFPGHALACQLYLEGGIRCVELGSLYLGTLDENNELVTAAPHELVRLALPRRVCTQSHYEYVAEVLTGIAHEIDGARRGTHPHPVAWHRRRLRTMMENSGFHVALAEDMFAGVECWGSAPEEDRPSGWATRGRRSNCSAMVNVPSMRHAVRAFSQSADS